MTQFELHQGDCLEVMKTLPDNSVDSIVTDPPYGISFMGKKWDYDVPGVDVWAEALQLFTDEHKAYSGLGGLFFHHEAINHSGGEYGRGMITTNSIESVWALLKRGITGVYHHTSKKHLNRYVNEFTFRLNFGNVKFHTLERLDSFISASNGKRLTYKELTA